MCISGQSHRMSGWNTENRLLQTSHKLIFPFFFLNQQGYVLKLEASLSSLFSVHNYFINWHTLPSILFGSHWKVGSGGRAGFSDQTLSVDISIASKGENRNKCAGWLPTPNLNPFPFLTPCLLGLSKNRGVTSPTIACFYRNRSCGDPWAGIPQCLCPQRFVRELTATELACTPPTAVSFLG